MIIIVTGASHSGKTVLAQRMLEKYKYPYETLNENNFNEFFQNYKEQKLKPILKSNLIYKDSEQIFNYKRKKIIPCNNTKSKIKPF